MLLRGLGSRAPLGAAAGGRRALEETAMRRGCRPRRPSHGRLSHYVMIFIITYLNEDCHLMT
jgi:hypothetical protein